MSSDSPLPPSASSVAADEQPPTPAPVPVAAEEQPPVPAPAPAVEEEESDPEEDPSTIPTESSPPASPEPKRRRLAPIDDTIVYEEIMHIRPSSSSTEWDWLPGMIRSWIREERVPPPFSFLRDPSSSFLPALGYPFEQVFAAIMAKMDREMRLARETAGEVHRISSSQERMNDDIIASIQEMDDNHDHLSDGMSELQAHITELTARADAAEALIVQLTNRLNDAEAATAAAEATANEAMALVEALIEDADQQLANQPAGPAEPDEEQGSQSTVSSAHSAN